MPDHRSRLRQLPAIDRILSSPRLADAARQHPHVLLREAAQDVVGLLRRQLLDGRDPDLGVEAVAGQVLARLKELDRPSLRRVINMTGTVLHTNLGRAPLCPTALAAIAETASGYSNLEYDLERGDRGQRFAHVEALLCRLTGGEAATVVNNNAGAVLLGLAALAGGRSALVSRGEMIEIGGSFRIPDVMAAGGVRLVEVGTTNKTRLDDYRQAIDSDTALILKVHTSNYRILGFTETVSGEELTGLARQHAIPILEDLGSGLLLDLTPYGLPREPTVRAALKSGIDVVTFSGDKLLGGPQAGIIAGRRDIVERLRKHPMARALRIDKLTLAALEATLRIYLDPERALREIPALSMLTQSVDQLRDRCIALITRIRAALGDHLELEMVEATATVGGGALPLTELPGWAIAVKPCSLALNRLTERLRATDPAVMGRVQSDRLLLDPRTLAEQDVPLLIAALRRACTPDRSP